MQRRLVEDDRGRRRGRKRGRRGRSGEGGSRAGGEREVEKVQEQEVEIAGSHLRQLERKFFSYVF